MMGKEALFSIRRGFSVILSRVNTPDLFALLGDVRWSDKMTLIQAKTERDRGGQKWFWEKRGGRNRVGR